MKKLFVFFISLILVAGCSQSKSELFKETDAFVQALETTYKSYGLLGGTGHSVTTSDGLYTITPIGRLISVRIEKVASDDEYKKLREDLEDHYEGDVRVNEVYISSGGTVIIDCRN